MDREETSVGSFGIRVGAGLKLRAVARIIDHFLIGIVSVSAVWISGYDAEFESTVLSAALVIAYFTLAESYFGRTIGKMILGLRTVGPGGGNPSFDAAFSRNAWYLLAVLPYVGGIAEIAAVVSIAVTISRSPANTGWHDIFAGGTRVVQVGS